MTRDRGQLEVPNRNGNVWPDDLCPAYTPREEAIESLKGCWYCRYADFHLKEERALEVGICKWPHKVLERISAGTKILLILQIPNFVITFYR